MKKILFLIGLLIASFAAQAQTPAFIYHIKSHNPWYMSVKVDSLIRINGTDTSDYPAATSKGCFMFQASDNQYYYSNGTTWNIMSGMSDSAFAAKLEANSVAVNPPLIATDTSLGLDTSSASPIPTKTYDASHYVTLSGSQTVTGAKTHTANINMANSVLSFLNPGAYNGVYWGGYTYMGLDLGLGYDAYVSANSAPTRGIDQWTQNVPSIASALLDLSGQSGIIKVYTAPVGQPTGSFAAFWTHIDTLLFRASARALYLAKSDSSKYTTPTMLDDSTANIRSDIDATYAKKTDVPTITSPLWDSPNSAMVNPSGTAGTDLQFQLSSLPYTSTVSSAAFASSVDNILIRIRFTYIIAVPATASSHIGISIDGGAIQNVTGTLAAGEQDGVIQIDLTNEVTNNQLRMSATNNGTLQAFGDLTGVDLSQNLTIKVYYNQATVAPVGNEAALQPFTVEVEDIPTAN